MIREKTFKISNPYRTVEEGAYLHYPKKSGKEKRREIRAMKRKNIKRNK